MTEQNGLPNVQVLQQAIDVIRRESLRCDQETGGILIGSRSKEGSFLVTHATPPGPNAVHNSVYFQRDVDYQQKMLNTLHERYGVHYLGEWHKHPRSLPVPSGGDLQGVKELLADPDYGVDSILFPIVICERDLGFQIHPFYISKQAACREFQHFDWHEVAFAMESDRVFTNDTFRPDSNTEKEKSLTTVQRRACSQLYQAWQRIGELLPFFSSSEKDRTANEDKIAQVPNNDNNTEVPQWYETEQGRDRLGLEQRLLRSFGLSADPFVTSSKNICFAFPRSGGREIVVVCTRHYPEVPPRLLVKDTGQNQHQSIKELDWNIKSCLVDVVVPMLGPSMNLV